METAVNPCVVSTSYSPVRMPERLATQPRPSTRYQKRLPRHEISAAARPPLAAAKARSSPAKAVAPSAAGAAVQPLLRPTIKTVYPSVSRSAAKDWQSSSAVENTPLTESASSSSPSAASSESSSNCPSSCKQPCTTSNGVCCQGNRLSSMSSWALAWIILLVVFVLLLLIGFVWACVDAFSTHTPLVSSVEASLYGPPSSTPSPSDPSSYPSPRMTLSSTRQSS